MAEQKDITTLTVEELKALTYDQLLIREQAQQNIITLQQELAKRQNDKSAGN